MKIKKPKPKCQNCVHCGKKAMSYCHLIEEKVICKGAGEPFILTPAKGGCKSYRWNGATEHPVIHK